MSDHSLPPLTPFDPKTMVQSVDAEGKGLRVVFVWRGDRWGHVIVAIAEVGAENEEAMPILVSQEGMANEPWPASPPLQSLSIERRAPGDVALLVGMAGQSHWSLSVEARGGELHFDAACRAGRMAQWLGSTYRRIGDTPLEMRAIIGGWEHRDEQIAFSPAHENGPHSRWSYVLSLGAQ